MAAINGQTKTYDLDRIPRPVKCYQHKPGDIVHFRTALGKINNEIMDPSIKRMGFGPLEVVEVGDPDQVRIRNKAGKEDIVHGIWLMPISVTMREDYPSK